MRKNRLLHTLALVAVMLCCGVASAEENSSAEDGAAEEENLHTSFAKFVTEGSAYIDARYRFEYVDQDGLPNEAKASTLRTRFGFDSGSVLGFNAKLEVEDVNEIGGDSFNNTINGKTDYPVVADVDSTEINQAWIGYEGVSDTVIRGGRETLKLDNVRFIGDVGWRQNNQTYDGINITNKSIENLKLFYAYVGNVNRIFGDDSPNGDFDTNLNLFNVQYAGIDAVTLTAYVYLFDVDDAPALSTANYGTRANGKYDLDENFAVLYDGEFAYQQDYEDNPNDYSAPYWRASVGGSSAGFSVIAGYESLGSDDGVVGFSTPFATLHAWNGWADKFLSTPEDGLEDAFLKVSYAKKDIHEYLQALNLAAVYHYFSSDNDSRKYGTEWDFNASAKLCEYLSLGVKYAHYEKANFATDTDKLVFTAQATFKQ